MEEKILREDLDLMYIVVKHGVASKIIKMAKKDGISGGTVFLGRGTVKSEILEMLALDEVRKEIVIMIADRNISHKFLTRVEKELRFDKPNIGVAFSTAISKIVGIRHHEEIKEVIAEKEGEKDMHDLVYVIVEKGNAEDVITAASKAGARGGTIINARGSGVDQSVLLFSMVIEPEKEVVLIVAEKHLTEKIVKTISDDMQIEKPGNGIIFVQSVDKTYGLVD